MNEKSTLNKIINDRIKKGFSVEFTIDEKFTAPEIKLTEMDGLSMRRFLMDEKLVPNYLRWKLKQDKEYMIFSNDLNLKIEVNKDFIDQIRNLFIPILKNDYPSFLDLIYHNIGTSKIILNVPLNLAHIVDTFHKLHLYHYITFSDLETLAEWLSTHFRYHYGKQYEPILKSQAYRMMTVEASKPKYPLIDIIRNQIVRLPGRGEKI
jgi:hypothetical protein